MKTNGPDPLVWPDWNTENRGRRFLNKEGIESGWKRLRRQRTVRRAISRTGHAADAEDIQSRKIKNDPERLAWPDSHKKIRRAGCTKQRADWRRPGRAQGENLLLKESGSPWDFSILSNGSRLKQQNAIAGRVLLTVSSWKSRSCVLYV